MNCLHCGAETTNGLALCELCRRLACSIFAVLPIYFRNLARWRPGRVGSREVPGSRVLWMGVAIDPDRTGDRISDALDEAFNMLGTRARELVDARPYLGKLLNRLSAAHEAGTIDEATTVAWLCVGFERYLTSMATLDMCGDFVRDLLHHEDRLRVLTESAAPGWYAGGCKLCGNATYVVPGLTWVTCNGVTGYIDGDKRRPIYCGATTYARDHLDIIIDEARDWTARPMRLAEAIVVLVDTEMSVPRLYDRIRQWASRDRIEPIRRTTRGYGWDAISERIVVIDEEVGYARYRLGDLLDVLLTEGATRIDRYPIDTARSMETWSRSVSG